MDVRDAVPLFLLFLWYNMDIMGLAPALRIERFLTSS